MSYSLLETDKKKKRISAGELVDMFKKPIKRKDSGAEDTEPPCKDEDESSGEENVTSEILKDNRQRRKSKTLPPLVASASTPNLPPTAKEEALKRATITLASSAIALPSREEQVKKVKKAKNLSYNDVSQLAEIRASPSLTEETPTPSSPGSPVRKDRELGENGGSQRKKSVAESGSQKMKRGVPAYMQNKFDLPREEVENMIRGNYCVSILSQLPFYKSCLLIHVLPIITFESTMLISPFFTMQQISEACYIRKLSIMA